MTGRTHDRPYRRPVPPLRYGTGHGDATPEVDDNFVTDTKSGLLIPAAAKRREFPVGFAPPEKKS